MTDRCIALLPDRGLLELRGPDAAHFLQGLVTNDVEKCPPGSAVFAGLLTPKGKIIADFLIFRRDTETFWVDAPRAAVADLVKRFGLYKLRAKVAITDLSERYAVGAAWDEGVRTLAEAGADAGVAGSFADPRYAPLGQRFIAERDADLAAQFVAAGDGDAADTAYHRHRIGLAVPQGGIDYAYGEAFPHEACYDALHGVDFRKGCYVGQEVVSRMHHKGVAKTRIAGVEGRAPLDQVGQGAEIEAGGKPVGQLGSAMGMRGVAMLRLDRLEDALAAGEVLRAGGVELTAFQPGWANYEVAWRERTA